MYQPLPIVGLAKSHIAIHIQHTQNHFIVSIE